jgi:hypothetical protein
VPRLRAQGMLQSPSWLKPDGQCRTRSGRLENQDGTGLSAAATMPAVAHDDRRAPPRPYRPPREKGRPATPAQQPLNHDVTDPSAARATRPGSASLTTAIRARYEAAARAVRVCSMPVKNAKSFSFLRKTSRRLQFSPPAAAFLSGIWHANCFARYFGVSGRFRSMPGEVTARGRFRGRPPGLLFVKGYGSMQADRDSTAGIAGRAGGGL